MNATRQSPSAAVPQNAPDIAVVIPTRNRRDALERAIDSVFTQTHQSFELIVVDDCSTDGTEAYLATISDPRLKWHRFGEWRNQNAARNKGVALSSAPILSFLDSDDRYLPQRLEETVSFFHMHGDVDVRLSSFTFAAGSKSDDMINPDSVLTSSDLERYVIGYCLHLGGSAISIRRRAFDDIGGFDEAILRMTDRDFLLSVARSRGCVSASRIDSIKIRSEDSVSNARIGRISALSAIYRRHSVISEKYEGLFRYLVAREIVTSLLNFQFGDARAAVTEAAFHRETAVSLPRLLPNYWLGRRLRHRLREELRARSGANLPMIPSQGSFSGHRENKVRDAVP